MMHQPQVRGWWGVAKETRNFKRFLKEIHGTKCRDGWALADIVHKQEEHISQLDIATFHTTIPT